MSQFEKPRWPVLLADQAASTPDATAVVDGRRHLTYRQLERRARRLASNLRRHGVTLETPVGLLLEPSADAVASAAGILAAGGAYVPLDPAYPAARIAAMTRDAGVGLVVTREALRSRLPPGCRFIDCDGPADAAGAGARVLNPSPEAAAYVLYTSGSTGEPKGVVVSHRALAWYCAAAAGHYRLRPGDRLLQLASISFDISVGEIFPVLAAGATLVIGGGARSDVFAAGRERAITVLFPATALWHELAELAEMEPAAVPRTLRLVSFGGEPVLAARIEAWRRSVGRRVRLVNGYGPTETTVEASLCDLSADGAASTRIGRPVAGARIHVVDPRLRRCRAGDAGELAITGHGLARGYLGRAAATAERFVPDPAARAPGARAYLTGDRGRWHPGGELELLGRLDRQVKVRGFRVEPGEVETALVRHPAVSNAAVVPLREGGGCRLAAFVVARSAAGRGGILGVGEPPPAAGTLEVELRTFLRQCLPEYMVPASYTLLDALPTSPNGKVDRARLAENPPGRSPPAPAARRHDAAGEAPALPAGGGSAEARLARIWEAVLRTDDVAPDDDFFELGGDSILAIQIVTRARRAGLLLAPRDLFDHPTIAELAAVTAPLDGRPAGGDQAADAPVTGTAPLTPVQCWFFRDAELAEPWHFNQSMLLAVRRPLDPALLGRAVRLLARQHDVLGSRFERRGGEWRQVFGGREPAPLACLDLSRLEAEDRPGALDAAAGRLQASLDFERGPIARFTWLDFGENGAARLLVAVHHLVVDAVSWSILLDDLERLYRGLERGLPARLAPRTTSYQAWAELQAAHAASVEVESEIGHWQAVSAGNRLPRDFPRGDNTADSADAVSVAFDPETTRRLLREAPAAYRTHIDDLLLCALARTLGPWAGAVTVDLESHGREEISEDVDLSRTVGWFTSTFPVHLDLEAVADPGEALVKVKETLRAIPRHGIGYGILRYLSDAGARVAKSPEVSFNYLGQLDALLAGSELFVPAPEPRGTEVSRRGKRAYPLEVDGGVVDGRLWINWRFSRALHRRSTIERLAEAYRRELETLVAHCLTPGAGAPTPSDFPLAGLDRRQLERLAEGGDFEDVYPLSPVQEGMLFHTLFAPRSAVYFEQSSWALAGDLDEDALRRAWGLLARRHPMLRTAFRWVDLDRPLQVVERRVEVPWRTVDWRGEEGDEATLLAALSRSERERGFDLRRAPLMRLVLARLGETTYRLLWSVHHLLLDGWSIAALFDELFTAYEALAAGREPDLPPRRPPRDFIAWLRTRNPAEDRAFWSRELAGFTAPTPLARADGAAGASGTAEVVDVRRRLGARRTAALAAFARRRRVTLANLFHAAWGVVLSRLSGTADVVFGATVSGRPATLAGADSIVGLLINTVPVRTRVTPEQPLLPWLEALQARGLKRQAHEHASLVEIRSWSEVPTEAPLFHSLLVFENFPSEVALEAEQRRCGLEIGDFRGYSQTHYPLTLSVLPGTRIVLDASVDPTGVEPLLAARLLRQIAVVLSDFVEHPGKRLGELDVLSRGERHQLLVEWSRRGDVPQSAVDVYRLFSRRADASPDAVAVVDETPAGGDVLTYGELRRRAGRLAGELRGRGVGLESRVGLALDRSPEQVVATLAVLETGGAYVPLDPDHPRQRLEATIAGSEVELIVTRGRTLATTAVPTLDLDRLRPGARRGDGVRAPSRASRQSLAYVLHTSGSTGAPKGVMVSHGALSDTLAAWEEGYRLSDTARRHLQVAAFSFDVAAGDLLRALGTGAALVLCPAGALLSPRQLIALIRRQRIDAVELVPALAELVDRQLEAEGATLDALRLLAVGSDSWRMEALCRLGRRIGRRGRLVSSYGVTEAAIDSTFFDPLASPAGGVPDGAAPVPLGRPFAGREAYVLDRRLEPVVAGARGELCLGGAGLARGYAGRPAATAERFVPHPFPSAARRPGSRLYRTGDRVRHLDDGQLEILGRVDHQLKIRGVRVEPGEVETALRSHPAVAEAVAVAREGPDGRVLTAFAVPEPGAPEPRPEDLRSFLERRLPGPMVPSRVVTRTALPLNHNGKVDRVALAGESWPDPARRPARESPATATERALAEVFRDLLGIERAGRGDDFFRLGGHSLSAVRLMVEIERRFGVRLELAALFRHATLAGLARLIDRPVPDGTAYRSLVEIARGNGRPPIFCVHPVGGNVLCYAELARRLGEEQPFYGLQSPELDGRRPLLGDVGAIAEHHLRTLRGAGSPAHGVLAGWSMGGIVAFEMARRLRQRGVEIAALVLIDCAAPGSPSAAAVDDEPAPLAFARDLGLLAADGPMPTKVGPEEPALGWILEASRRRGLALGEIGRRDLERRYRLFASNAAAMKRYRPRPYDGPLTLVRSAQWRGDPTLGWSAFAHRVDVRIVGGDHFAMVEGAHVAELAAELSRVLDRLPPTTSSTTGNSPPQQE